jgi:DnaJ-class molecular chaperone
MDLAIDIQKAYQDLDLTPGASLDEVKQAYRRLARALHPDLNPGALGALMGRVNQAYEKLLRHLDGQRPHQAGPARGAQDPQADASPKQRRSRQAGFSAYEYEVFQAARGAHGEHARRKAAWQDLKRRFYEQAREAAQAAARAKEMRKDVQTEAKAPATSPVAGVRPMADEGQVLSPSDPRVAPAKAMVDEPVTGPLGIDRKPADGWRLLGLDKQDGVLLYRVELSGRPDSISLPVRCCRTCPQCDGAGRYRDRAGLVHRCPSCGGRGRITRADRVKVALPDAWKPGQCMTVPACNSDGEIIVQLNPASAE